MEWKQLDLRISGRAHAELQDILGSNDEGKYILQLYFGREEIDNPDGSRATVYEGWMVHRNEVANISEIPFFYLIDGVEFFFVSPHMLNGYEKTLDYEDNHFVIK